MCEARRNYTIPDPPTIHPSNTSILELFTERWRNHQHQDDKSQESLEPSNDIKDVVDTKDALRIAKEEASAQDGCGSSSQSFFQPLNNSRTQRYFRASAITDGARLKWGGDLTCKCHLCGQVGHRENVCPWTEDSLCVCHLCGGRHLPTDCPGASKTRTANKFHLCSQCGDSEDHAIGKCPWADEIDFHPDIKCMCCGLVGHAWCQIDPPIPVPNVDQVYCPECGGEGHYRDEIDICRQGQVQMYVPETFTPAPPSAFVKVVF